MNIYGSETAPVGSFRVLVVEDDSDIRQILSVYLKHCGFDVSCASDGQEAIPLIISYQPHLLILDLMMRPVDGWEVLQWLNTQRLNPPLPVLVLTARSRLEEQLRGFEAGAIDYIVKPTQPSMIVDRINALLGLSAEQRSLFQRKCIDERRSMLERARAQQDDFIY